MISGSVLANTTVCWAHVPELRADSRQKASVHHASAITERGKREMARQLRREMSPYPRTETPY